MEKIDEYSKNLSATLKELRKTYGFTQKQVAEKLGVSYQSYQAYERRISFPSLPIFIELAELYDVSLDFLVGRKEY